MLRWETVHSVFTRSIDVTEYFVFTVHSTQSGLSIVYCTVMNIIRHIRGGVRVSSVSSVAGGSPVRCQQSWAVKPDLIAMNEVKHMFESNFFKNSEQWTSRISRRILTH